MARPVTVPTNRRGKRLLKFLQRSRLTLTGAAKLAKVRFEVIQRLLHEPDYVPETETITRLVEALGCPLALIAPKLARAA